MAEINPLSFIGRSNDPSLTQRTVNASSALDALRSSGMLQTMKGRNQLATQGSANEAAMARKALELGLPALSDPGYGAARAARGTQMGDERLAGIALQQSQGGLARAQAGFGPIKVEGGVSDVLGGQNPLQRQLPISVAASKASVPTLASSEKAGIKDVSTVYDKKKGRFLTRTETGEVTQTGKGGPLAPQRVNQLHALVTDMLTKKGRPAKDVKIIDVDDTHVTVSIDGADPVRIRMDVDK